MQNKTLFIISMIFLGSIIFSIIAYATSFSDSNILFTQTDPTLYMPSVNSLLGSPTAGTGGIYFNQTVPGAKGGIWWDAYDAASGKVRTASWIVTHYNSSANGDAHSHFAIEVLNNFTETTASVDTVFAIKYGSTLHQSEVTIYNADFVVNDLALINTTGKIKFTPVTTLEIYPWSQSTYALQVSNSTNKINLATLGSNYIGFDDHVEIAGSRMLILDANTTAYNCNATYVGSIYFDGTTKTHYGCNSTDWNSLY